MTKKQVIKLLKSGNFTIAYHDNGYGCLYEGKYEYEDLPEKEVYTFDDQYDGYVSETAFLLIEALGGKTVTI